MRHEGAKAEGIVGTLMFVGAIMAGIGVLLIAVLFIAGVFHATASRGPGDQVTSIGPASFVPLAVGVVGLGALMFVAGLAYGFYNEYRGVSGQWKRLDNVRVIARYGFTRDGLMLSDWEVDGHDSARTYVKLDLGRGVMQEFECSRETYFLAGEGMTGAADVQGRWMGRFIPVSGQMMASRPGSLDGL